MKTPALLHANNTCTDKPVRLLSPLNAFGIHILERIVA